MERLSWRKGVAFFRKSLGKNELLAIISFLVFFASWWILFGWQFAALIAAFVLFHEYIHMWAAIKMGLMVKKFFFIPFLEAITTHTEMPEPYRKKGFMFTSISFMGQLIALIEPFTCGWVSLSMACLITGQIMFSAIAFSIGLATVFDRLPLGALNSGKALKLILFSYFFKPNAVIDGMFWGILLLACSFIMWWGLIFLFVEITIPMMEDSFREIAKD